MSQTVHTHDEDVRTNVGGVGFAAMNVLRLVLTMAGAAILLVAMFQPWVHGANGDTLAFNAYWKMSPAMDVAFWRSAALVPLGCAIVAVIGLITIGGWLTRLAGAVAIVAFGLIVIELVRASATLPDDMGAGLWLMLGGGVGLLIASLAIPSTSES